MTALTQWILDQGVTRDALLLFLFIPVLSTLVTSFRYILGIKSFGLYAPMVLAISYYFTGIKYGLIITTLVIVASLITHYLLRKIRMHYVARTSINYTIIAIVLILATIAINAIPGDSTFLKFDKVEPLAIVSIATLSDFFIRQYVKKSLTSTLRALAESVAIAIIGVLLIRSHFFADFLINNIWIAPVLIIVNLLIGRYVGLRLTELYRFRQIIKNAGRNSH